MEALTIARLSFNLRPSVSLISIFSFTTQAGSNPKSIGATQSSFAFAELKNFATDIAFNRI
ncbi:hypothetical protein EBR21_13765 [bacterium]|nr:hypothetical protein [bacterium]